MNPKKSRWLDVERTVQTLKNTQCPKKTILKIHHFNTGTTLRLTNNDSENKFNPAVTNTTLRNKLKFEKIIGSMDRPKSRAMRKKLTEPRVLAEFSVAFRDYAFAQTKNSNSNLARLEESFDDVNDASSSSKKRRASYFVKAVDLQKIFLDVELKLGYSIINEVKLDKWLKANSFRDHQAMSYKEYMKLAKAMMTDFIHSDENDKNNNPKQRRKRHVDNTAIPQTSWDNLSYENYFKGAMARNSNDENDVNGQDVSSYQAAIEAGCDNNDYDINSDNDNESSNNARVNSHSTSYLINQRKSAEASLFTYDNSAPNSHPSVSVSADEMVSLVKKQHWQQRKEEKAKKKKQKQDRQRRLKEASELPPSNDINGDEIPATAVAAATAANDTIER